MSRVFNVALLLFVLWGLTSEFGHVKRFGLGAKITYGAILLCAIGIWGAVRLKMDLIMPTVLLTRKVAPWVQSLIPS